MNIANKVLGKDKITRLVDVLITLVEKSNIEVRPKTEADAGMVKRDDPDDSTDSI